MIIILFLSVLLVIYLVRYFEQKRRTRIQEHKEKQKEKLNNLLTLIKENKTDKNEP